MTKLSLTRQLAAGTKIELEHTRSRRIARKIAMDHLREFPDYYTRLRKMERQTKAYWRTKGSKRRRAKPRKRNSFLIKYAYKIGARGPRALKTKGPFPGLRKALALARYKTQSKALAKYYGPVDVVTTRTGKRVARLYRRGRNPELDEMIAEARRWQGAALKADASYGKDTRKRMKHSRLTLKGNLDAYLMRRFGVDSATARDVSNTLTHRDIKPDMSGEIGMFSDEPWAKLALEK